MSKTPPSFVPVPVYGAFGPKPPFSPTIFEGPSMTRQEFKDNGNLDIIVERFSRGIPIPELDRPPSFGDVSNVPSYQAAQDIIIRAQKAFDSLSPKVRKRIKSPLELVEFLSDPDNRTEAVALGLVQMTQPAALAPAGGGGGTPPADAPGASATPAMPLKTAV